KCGCTEVKIGSDDIPPGTQTTVELTLDTANKPPGYKPSGATLIFSKPEQRRGELNLSCFIRADVTVTPGPVDFGVVPRGTTPTVTSTLDYNGGKADWKITALHTISPDVSAQLRELGRSADGAVQYQLSTTLSPSAPSGHFRDEITLLTNDPGSPVIPVAVTATVQSSVSATASVLNLRHLKPTDTVPRDVRR